MLSDQFHPQRSSSRPRRATNEAEKSAGESTRIEIKFHIQRRKPRGHICSGYSRVSFWQCREAALAGAAAVEGRADRAGEVHLPGLREDQPGAGTVRRAAARPCRAESARHDPVREVRATPAAQSAVRALRARGH